jgi:tetratricopeptide (TPR) repeat protein
MHMRPAWALLLCVGAAVAAPPGRASAQAQRDAEATKTREAREHYDKGIARYNLGEFEPAIAEFKEAYELTKAPRLLFNIAQAHRLKKDWEQAFYFYSTYLRLQPDAPNRSDVENRIAEMSRLMKEPPPPKPVEPPKPPGPIEPARPPVTAPPIAPGPVAPPPVAAPPLSTPPPTGTHTRAPTRGLRIAGYTAGAAGLALVGTAIYFSVAARDASDQLNALARTGGVWDARNQSLFSDGERAGAAAIALYTVGGAAVVTGVVLTALGHRRVPATLSLAPTPGGAFVGLAAELP